MISHFPLPEAHFRQVESTRKLDRTGRTAGCLSFACNRRIRGTLDIFVQVVTDTILVDNAAPPLPKKLCVAVNGNEAIENTAAHVLVMKKQP